MVEEDVPAPVPDFAAGRGGDGIGGFGMPADCGADVLDEVAGRYDGEEGLLGQLRRILGCPVCPPSDDGQPPLHHPITLPCGHTIPSEHISIPAPAPLVINSDLPHEVAAAQQRHHQERLKLWAGTMCLISSCKRFTPGTSVATKHEHPSEEPSSPPPADTEAQPGAVLASGVKYFLPPVPDPPPSSPEVQSTTVSTSALLDVCVEKTLLIVLQEMDRENLEAEASERIRDIEAESEDDDDSGVGSPEPKDNEDDDASAGGSPESEHDDDSAGGSLTTISPRNPVLDQSEHSLTNKRISKRRRNTPLDESRSLASRPSSASPDEYPFLKELSGVLECDVCAMLLHEPVTTPCQHSFCSKCLSRSLDHSSRCPVCRQDLPSFAFFQDYAVNKVLLAIIKTAFPDEYAERRRAIERDERDARLETPIFICTLAFPGMPTILHVFEPRYRLMIRRCIESSSPCFGMLLPARATGSADIQGVSEYGTMLVIQSVQMLPDGRSMVETVGTHRFKLLEKGNLDGYNVGRVERIDDISPVDEASLEREAVARAAATRAQSASAQPPTQDDLPESGTPLAIQPAVPAEEAAQTTEEYMHICRAFIEQLRSGSAPWLLQRLNNTYGTMPTDPSEFSYWMALVMPIDEYEKARLLPIRSPRLRLKVIVHWIESLRSSWWFSSGCVVG